jgi:tetratricopeptide (TPR) repeat protein
MARVSGLTEAKDEITLAQKMAGTMMAEMWSRSDNPPIGSDKAGYYAAALTKGVSGDARARVARCLLWCDFMANRYCLNRLEWYAESLLGSPQDERSVFYVAALCNLKVIQEPQLTAFAYHQLLNPAWDRSPYWNRFALPQKNILREVANLYASMPHIIAPDRIDIVERALEQSEDRVSERKPLAEYLAKAYRTAERTDEMAEIVYRYVFTHVPDDTENNSFLARLYLQRQKQDSDACAVFARMVGQADSTDNTPEANYWVLQLAQTYLGMGRVDEGTLLTYKRAFEITPENQDLRAAMLCSLARRRDGKVDRETVSLLEQALEEEKTLSPRFTTRRWDWSLIIRALAYAYGTEERTDDEAMAIYTRATEVCPEERDIWGFRAKGLALRGDFSAEAMVVYERALRTLHTDEGILIALARAYIRNNAYEGEHRVAALQLWENLYRQGIHWPEMVQALAKAYTAEDRVNDIALTLWEKSLGDDEKNGPIRLRLAQEYRSRSEYDLAGKYYREAAKLLPKDFVAQYEAATLLREHLNDNVSAIRLLQKAIKLPAGQKHLYAHFILGEALLEREKRDEAQEIFQKIVEEIDANHTPTLLHLAKLSLKYEEDSVKQAEAFYEQAKTVDPAQPETYRRMAELYHEKGEYEEEERALEKYLELAEPDAEKLMQLADLYIRRSEYSRAETMLRRVIGLGKGDKKIYTLLGEVITQAQRQSLEAEAKSPPDPDEEDIYLTRPTPSNRRKKKNSEM